MMTHEQALAEVERLCALINNPHTDDFLEAVRTEAARQRERLGTDHDAGKDSPDWFWHHIITTAAACLNWHAAVSGADTMMMPGIAPPDGEKSSQT